MFALVHFAVVKKSFTDHTLAQSDHPRIGESASLTVGPDQPNVSGDTWGTKAKPLASLS
jgi:hypothetical protein